MTNFEKWENNYNVLPDLLEATDDETWNLLRNTVDECIWSDCDLETEETMNLSHIEPGLEIYWRGSKYVGTFDEESSYFKIAKKPRFADFEVEVPYWVATECLACGADPKEVALCVVCDGEGEWKFEL